ncbi:MAG TPA: hypothetical protein VGX28_08375 [Frankiaceae bacterium]|jgi:hypothetical protein|nr:hypothetical protein [Frankiaceae bacterium]
MHDDPEVSTAALVNHVRKRVLSSRAGEVAIVAQGIDDDAVDGQDRDESLDYVDGLLYRQAKPPGWATRDSPYVDVIFELVLYARRRRLIAVHCSSAIQESLLNWLDGEPAPPLRLVPPGILNGTFLRGRTRSLWLHGTHPHRSTKADTKSISGTDLGDALNPFEDSTYAMKAARSTVPDGGPFKAITGVVGITLRKGLVWISATDSYSTFKRVVLEALDLVEATIAAHGGLDRPYPLLAAETDDLLSVQSAYEVSVIGAGDLVGPDADPDVVAAAELLERAILDVRPGSAGADFVMDVGLNGSVAGAVQCTVKKVRRKVLLTFGWAPGPTSPDVVRQVVDALQKRDLVTVHYLSGHSIHDGALYRSVIPTAPFRRWQFEDFDGFDVTCEKPPGSHADIHRLVGSVGDTSLFGWVVRTYHEGWLTCDDGPGEVADFVHLADDGTLSLIHVKAAKTDHPARKVSASAYEIVQGQATKNVQFLDTDPLLSSGDPAVPH